MTSTSTTSPVTADSVNAFRLRVKGSVLVPGSDGYETAREIHNARIDRRPSFIVRVQDAADVSRCIHFARRHGLEIAVRSGGHSIPGHSMVDGGLVIDMSEMNEVRIDPERRVAWAQPGATAGLYADEAQKHGLATPFGDAGSVGLGGITLGGGIGFLARRHGLAIDHLLAVELVTAEGRIVNASAKENADLFWALRGGGGNFGVVTGFQFRLVEVGTILGGVLVLPATKDVLKRYAEVSQEAPEGLTTIAMLMAAPPMPFIPADNVGTLVLGIFVCYTGDLAEGEQAVAPLRALAEPIADVVMPMPYSAIYQFAEEAAKRRREKVRSAFMPDLPEGVIDAMLEFGAKGPGPFAIMQIRPLGGEMSRVPSDATAFTHRDARFMVAIIDLWEERAADQANRDWVDAYWERIRDFGNGVYSNFLGNEGEARVREAYSAATYASLGEVKETYDPENVFSRNQNIRPARMTEAA